MKRNRWLIALAAAGIHICIGSVYAWSVLTKPVMAEMGLSLSETTWAFSIAIYFLGFPQDFLAVLWSVLARASRDWFLPVSSPLPCWGRH